MSKLEDTAVRIWDESGRLALARFLGLTNFPVFTVERAGKEILSATLTHEGNTSWCLDPKGVPILPTDFACEICLTYPGSVWQRPPNETLWETLFPYPFHFLSLWFFPEDGIDIQLPNSPLREVCVEIHTNLYGWVIQQHSEQFGILTLQKADQVFRIGMLGGKFYQVSSVLPANPEGSPEVWYIGDSQNKGTLQSRR